jgi:Endonuclease NucS C-terminal domain
MPSIYPKSTKELFREFTSSFVPPPAKGFGPIERKPLADGGHFTRQEILNWFQGNYPKIKKGTVNAHLIVMSTNAPSRVHHNISPGGADDLLFQMDRSNFRLYARDSDPPPIYALDSIAGIAEDTENDEDEGKETHEFAYENDLKNFLVNNLHVIRPSLAVYQDGDISGVEFPVGGRYVDILAIEDGQTLVVIELKVSKGYDDRALGQILRYMGWIKENLAEPNQEVKGIIIAKRISADLRLATSSVAGVELFEYELSIRLNRIAK